MGDQIHRTSDPGFDAGSYVDQLERQAAEIERLKDRVYRLTAEREEERSSRQAWAEEAMRLEMASAEAATRLREEIAWQKHAYRDGKDRLVTARTIGMEDALRTIREVFAAARVEGGDTSP